MLFEGEELQEIEDPIGDHEIDEERVDGFSIPGCPDRDIGHSSAPETPVINVHCVNEASSIPNAIFSSDKNNVYRNFCNAATLNRNTLQWNFDVFGNLRTSTDTTLPKPRMNRGLGFFERRDDNPDLYTNWQFKLDWAPNGDYNPEDNCYLDYETAFGALAASTCGQKGDGKNMSQSSQIEVGCGTFGYTVKGIAIS